MKKSRLTIRQIARGDMPNMSLIGDRAVWGHLPANPNYPLGRKNLVQKQHIPICLQIETLFLSYLPSHFCGPPAAPRWRAIGCPWAAGCGRYPVAGGCRRGVKAVRVRPNNRLCRRAFGSGRAPAAKAKEKAPVAGGPCGRQKRYMGIARISIALP